MKDEIKKQERTYLLLVIGICYILGITGLFTNNGEENVVFDILQKLFTTFPVLCAFLTRKLLHDKEKVWFSVKVWKDWKMWLACAVIPSVLIGIGAAAYYLVFPQEYSGVFNYGALVNLTGATAEGTMTVEGPIGFWLVVTLIAAVFIPIQLLELGEEIGWRGYVLPKQIRLYGTAKAVLINGLMWGVAHMPLIYFGFNYSLENPFAPWSNMLVMMLVCIVTGIIMSYVTVKTKNCMYAAIIHGVFNIAGEVPVFLSVSGKSGLLGPNPTGLVGMGALIVCSAVLYAVMLRNKDME